jgi:hypothetical protein
MKEGCIWDEELILGGISGLCKTGACENLSGENVCNSVLNHDMCAYYLASCKKNPCADSDCEGNITAGYKVSNRGTYVVDKCMKYDEVGCKTDGSSSCVIISNNSEDRCVFGECSILKSGDDCVKNDNRCKLVKDVCVENPCVDSECNSVACQKEGDECIYDECAQYIPSGMNI